MQAYSEVSPTDVLPGIGAWDGAYSHVSVYKKILLSRKLSINF